MNRHCRRPTALCLAVLLLLSAFWGCQAKQTKYTDQSFEWFDSFYSLTVYTESESEFETYSALCRSVLSEYHRLLDIYHSYDGVVNLKTLNESGGAPLEVSEKLFSFLSFAKEADALTEGYTNVAMGGVIDLWHEAQLAAAQDPNKAYVPADEVIAEALAHTDLGTVHLDADCRKVTLTDPQVSLNAGAVGKGYAAQKAAEALSEAGCENFLLNLGGNLVAYGQKPHRQAWQASIRKPDDHEGYEKAIPLDRQALVSSGSYERYFTVDGVHYHHILNPDTGKPENRYVSVSVLAGDSAMADALSTALFSMTPDEGLRLIESLADTEAVWLLADGGVLTSSGLS